MKRVLAVASVAAMAFSACSGDGESGEPAPALDIVRDQLAAANTIPIEQPDDESTTVAIDEIPAREDLPQPDASQFVGRNRVVNLWVSPDGENQAIDVWGRRTFTNGPILLAENVPFGEATGYFSAPSGYSLVMVGTGAGPDGEELGGLFNAEDGEQITAIFTNDESGAVFAPNLWETDLDGQIEVPEEPPSGRSVVWMYSANTDAFDQSLTTSVGGSSFYVGDGSSECRPQRIEEEGFQASILGGTQRVELVVDAGPSIVTLHPFFSPDGCDQPAAAEIVTDTEAGETVLVLLYTPDGERLDWISLPVIRE
jgi:hypothetical protein